MPWLFVIRPEWNCWLFLTEDPISKLTLDELCDSVNPLSEVHILLIGIGGLCWMNIPLWTDMAPGFSDSSLRLIVAKQTPDAPDPLRRISALKTKMHWNDQNCLRQRKQSKTGVAPWPGQPFPVANKAWLYSTASPAIRQTRHESTSGVGYPPSTRRRNANSDDGEKSNWKR